MAELWYCSTKQTTLGPFALEVIQRLASSGQLLPDDPIWRVGAERRTAVRAATKIVFAQAKPPAASGSLDWLNDVRVSEEKPSARLSPPPPPKSLDWLNDVQATEATPRRAQAAPPIKPVAQPPSIVHPVAQRPVVPQVPVVAKLGTIPVPAKAIAPQPVRAALSQVSLDIPLDWLDDIREIEASLQTLPAVPLARVAATVPPPIAYSPVAVQMHGPTPTVPVARIAPATPPLPVPQVKVVPPPPLPLAVPQVKALSAPLPLAVPQVKIVPATPSRLGSAPRVTPASPSQIPLSLPVPAAPALPVTSQEVARVATPAEMGYNPETGQILDAAKYALWQQQEKERVPEAQATVSILEVFLKARNELNAWVDDDRNRQLIVAGNPSVVRSDAQLAQLIDAYENYGPIMREKLWKHLDFLVENRRRFFAAT